MKPKRTGAPRAQRSRSLQAEGTNWVLIVGGALLSTLSIRLGHKLKQVLDTRQQGNTSSQKSSERRKSSGCQLHPNVYSLTEDDGNCFNCFSENEGAMEIKCQPDGQMLGEPNGSLPLVTVPVLEFSKENSVIWASSLDRLDLPPKPFQHHSNCSDSPCVSESGSDIFSKREVIQKLRQQLKRRDDMILEMQDQITEQQNSLNAEFAGTMHLKSQLDAANRDLFDSQREIQRLRKAIADHCMGHLASNDSPSAVAIWASENRNGHANGFLNGVKFEPPEKARTEERIEMIRREVGELKEIIEGKNYLLQSYKEQKEELSVKIKELQQRLDSQLPNIL